MYQRKRNVGIHRFRVDGKLVVARPGDMIDVPEGFFGVNSAKGYDLVEPLPVTEPEADVDPDQNVDNDVDPDQNVDNDVDPDQDVFLVAPDAAPGWYNVLKDGQPVNKGRLRKNAAEELKKELEA